MAVKNLQTVASFVANTRGVVVTGMECKGSMRLWTPGVSTLPRLPRPGSYPAPTSPDATLSADNAATAKAVTRVGRSAKRGWRTRECQTIPVMATAIDSYSPMFTCGLNEYYANSLADSTAGTRLPLVTFQRDQSMLRGRVL